MSKLRARDLGLPLPGQPGPANAITDVPGVEVGHTTLIEGADIRTGVTVILPAGKTLSAVPAGYFALNGNGELTGTAWVAEGGFLEGPIGLTNTCSVGLVRDTLRKWEAENFTVEGLGPGLLPVVGETYDGFLNDIEAQHLKPEHVFAALTAAASGPVAEGAVGGGTGMIAFEFKAGIGTSSRQLEVVKQSYTVGVLVQANFGVREQLTMAGKPLGEWLADLEPRRVKRDAGRDGSIIGILATDAPLLPQQLQRLAKRMALGLARTGGLAHNSSGDLFLAFSTACPQLSEKGLESWNVVPNHQLDGLFAAAAQATEEAILNALTAAEPMTGFQGHSVTALPQAQVRAWFAKQE
ncbi:MAG: P1 family peptidase [Candidatus Sericytochromatia bacterium]